MRSTDVEASGIDTKNLLHVEHSFAEERASKRVRAGDLLTQRTGEYSGATAVVPDELDGCQCFTMLITTPIVSTLDPQFAVYFIQSLGGVGYFDQARWGSAQPNISVPILRNMPICVPPLSEQVNLVEHLRDRLQELDSLADQIRAGVTHLQELRTALISAAVTGKIDVREEA